MLIIPLVILSCSQGRVKWLVMFNNRVCMRLTKHLVTEISKMDEDTFPQREKQDREGCHSTCPIEAYKDVQFVSRNQRIHLKRIQSVPKGLY
jgi:hypothetical protein